MSNNKGHHFGPSVGDFIAPDQLKEIMAFATGPTTLQDKLRLFDKLSEEHMVSDKRNPERKTRRSRLGGYVNNIFNTTLILPTVGRWQQIAKAIKFGKTYLQENPAVSVYYAVFMGAAQEYREWQALVGGLTEEQQLDIVKGDESVQS